jgi:hypothetical protein
MVGVEKLAEGIKLAPLLREGAHHPHGGDTLAQMTEDNSEPGTRGPQQRLGAVSE